MIMENECKHARVRFVVDAPLEDYFRCSLNENKIPYGYCCMKCTPNPRGIAVGLPMSYKPKQSQYFNEFRDLRDVFSKRVINLNLILEDETLLGTSSSLLTKTTLVDLKEKEYKVIDERRSQRRTMVSVEVLKRHCLYMCIPSKCSICIRGLNIPKEFYDYASANAKELIPFVIEEILENESETEEFQEMIGEKDERSEEEHIPVKEIKQEHPDESVTLKEEYDEEFQTSKRLFIDEQDENKENVPPKRIKTEHPEESAKETNSDPRTHRKIVIVDSEEE